MNALTTGSSTLMGNLGSAFASVAVHFLPIFAVLALIYICIALLKGKRSRNIYSASDIRAMRIAKVSGYEPTGSRNGRGELTFKSRGSSSGSSTIRRGGSSAPVLRRGGGSHG